MKQVGARSALMSPQCRDVQLQLSLKFRAGLWPGKGRSPLHVVLMLRLGWDKNHHTAVENAAFRGLFIYSDYTLS